MKKIWILIFILCYSIIWGQKANPLFQVIYNNPMIIHNETIRKMQDEISSKIKETKYGLEIRPLENILQDARERFQNYLESFQDSS